MKPGSSREYFALVNALVNNLDNHTPKKPGNDLNDPLSGKDSEHATDPSSPEFLAIFLAGKDEDQFPFEVHVI
jgi:hypothetical protein